MTKRPSDEESPAEGTPDEKKPCVRYEHCQDAHHVGTAEDLRRCRKDGKVRCKNCRQDQKRKEDAVGTRGLDLAAHFRSKQLQQRHLPAVEVIVSSPSDDDVKETEDATKPVDFAIDPAAPLKIEEESTTDVPNTSPSSPSSNAAKKKPKKREALGKGVKCLHIGCDVCPRWFVVDQVLFDHWCNEKFTCCMVGESCSRKETHTALVACKGVPQMLSRHGRPVRKADSRPQLLPGGCWDVWRPGSALSSAAPAPRVFAAPMTAVSPRWREEAAKLFDKGWTQEASQKTIRYLLQCEDDPLFVREQRRKKHPSLILWLLWQESPAKKGEVGSMLSVAILSRQRYTSKGPVHLQGGMVLEYISVEPGTGAKAYWLVQAAEEVALLMGHTELFSACDLNQRGTAFDGRAKPALEAHRRWGFEDTDQKEWTDRRFEVYSAGCSVRYMVKIVGR